MLPLSLRIRILSHKSLIMFVSFVKCFHVFFVLHKLIKVVIHIAENLVCHAYQLVSPIYSTMALNFACVPVVISYLYNHNRVDKGGVHVKMHLEVMLYLWLHTPPIRHCCMICSVYQHLKLSTHE